MKTKERHGGRWTSEYRVWLSMRGRCQNVRNRQWGDYGGRGITVCERWNSFKAFLDDMGRRPSLNHSIDRIDNNGGYEPGNCRWATSREQNLNTRRNIMVTAWGETKPLSVWCESLGLRYMTVRGRIRSYGWDPEMALAAKTNAKSRMMVRVNGELMSYKDAAKMFGMSGAAALHRCREWGAWAWYAPTRHYNRRGK